MTITLSNAYEPVDFILVRGGDVTIYIDFKQPKPSDAYQDMSGRTVIFRAARKGIQPIQRTITSFITVEGLARRAAITLTRAELRRLSDDPTPWEIEDRNGGNEIPVLGGNLYGTGGVNPDAA